jgi:hypothetical protein
MKYKINKIIYLALFQIFILESCDNTYHLDSRDRMIIDTTANTQIAKITKTLDDSALIKRPINIKKITDSLVEFQLKAIAKKLNPN